jgi:hypothetical protein
MFMQVSFACAHICVTIECVAGFVGRDPDAPHRAAEGGARTTKSDGAGTSAASELPASGAIMPYDAALSLRTTNTEQSAWRTTRAAFGPRR